MTPAAIVALVAVGFVVALLARARYARSVVDRSERVKQRGPDGVVAGGESFLLARARAPAVLLIHGAGDTPQTLRYLGDALYAHGFHVSAPLLPGHARTIRDFSRVTADDLTNAVRGAYADVRATHDWVGVIGLSMGGALAVQLAAEHPDLPALGLVAPYLSMPAGVESGARLAWLWGPFFPFVRSSGSVSILDPVERERSLAYGMFTPGALIALRDTMRRALSALPRVVAPTIMIQSRGDNRISVAGAERAFSLLGARDKRLEWITGAAHIITVDYGRERVFSALIAWLQARAPVGA